MATGDFTIEDFQRQIREFGKFASLAEVMKIIPGLDGLARRVAESGRDRDPPLMVSLIRSMTRAERDNPDLIDESRCRRIACGSGSEPEEVWKLLADFRALQQMMQKFASMKIAERMRQVRRMAGQDLPPGRFRGFELN